MNPYLQLLMQNRSPNPWSSLEAAFVRPGTPSVQPAMSQERDEPAQADGLDEEVAPPSEPQYKPARAVYASQEEDLPLNPDLEIYQTGPAPKTRPKAEIGAQKVYPWRRFFARVIENWFASSCLSVGAFGGVITLGLMMPTATASFEGLKLLVLAALAGSLVCALILVAFNALLTSTAGITPAKLIFGLRIVPPQAKKLVFAHAFAREWQVFFWQEVVFALVVAVIYFTLGSSLQTLAASLQPGVTPDPALVQNILNSLGMNAISNLVAVPMIYTAFYAWQYFMLTRTGYTIWDSKSRVQVIPR